MQLSIINTKVLLQIGPAGVRVRLMVRSHLKINSWDPDMQCAEGNNQNMDDLIGGTLRRKGHYK